MRLVGLLAAAAFVGTVVAANWALDTYGLVDVGFGLQAPAGVYFAGLAFLLRDVVQRTSGRAAAGAAILIGAGVSALIDPTLAVASACAFLASEFADLATFSALERRLTTAVVASNIVGAVVDSLLFLWLAFGTLQFWQGQVVGKLWVTAAALPFLFVLRKRAVA